MAVELKMIRELRSRDLIKLKEIHGKYYEKEFKFPDFRDHFICAYVVEDEGRIITAGGVRTIVECIAITDKDISVRDRIHGLGYILNASKYFSEQSNYHEIHAFVQDEGWKRQLLKKGFTKTRGQSLVLEI